MFGHERKWMVGYLVNELNGRLERLGNKDIGG